MSASHSRAEAPHERQVNTIYGLHLHKDVGERNSDILADLMAVGRANPDPGPPAPTPDPLLGRGL